MSEFPEGFAEIFAQYGHAGNGQGELRPLEFANLALDGVEVPEPEWSVPNRIPSRQACLFTGHGAAGKSTIGLHLCVAHVLGREWLGSFPQLGPAIFLDAEDDFNVIWRRLDAVRKHYDTSYQDLINGGLHILPMAGKDVVLAGVDSKTNKITPTPFYYRLLEQAITLRAEQVLIASAANVFAGNENDRAQVQQFEGLLVNIAQQTGGSVTLIGHPSRRGMDEDGGGFSGSTAWHNSFRSRIWIEGEKDVPDLRRISFLKNQYGPEDESFTVQWRNGMFLAEAQPSSYEQAATDNRAENIVLDFIREQSRHGQDFGASRCAHSYPATMIDKAGLANGFKKPELAAATSRLIDKGTLRITKRGRYNYVVIT
jgi:RecA-family ATPase